jgi:hypothetical protein
MNNLYVFLSHLDDLEFSCLSYILNSDYKKVKVIVATTWAPKEKIFEKNLKILKSHVNIEYINLGFKQRLIPTYFDKVKDKFYKNVDFNSEFDIITHDADDAHTDHKALHNIALGLFKYCNRFITVYSPEAINFKPNFYVEMNDMQIKLKNELLDNYNFNEEQSYAQKGTYFNNNRIDLPKLYALENFHGRDIEGCEIFKIYKWFI